MYEPYGEENKKFNLKEKFNQLKQKIAEKFKRSENTDFDSTKTRFNKVTLTVISLGLLLLVGGISGYITYTNTIEELEAQNLLLQKRVDSLETDLNNAQQEFSQCSSNLQFKESELTQMTLNYQTTQTDLQTCNEDKVTLSSDLNLMSEQLDQSQQEYDELKKDYDDLRGDYKTMTCKYAKASCSPAGMNYYFLDSEESVVCCLNSNTCVKNPDGEDVIEITC